MSDAESVKNAMKEFYRSEAADRSGEAWVAEGGSARIPEPGASHYFIDRKVGEAVKLARLGRDSRVLEVGSSWGHMTFVLATLFREVVAVDLSPESVALGNQRARHYGVTNVRFLAGDAERLEALEDRFFDGVFSFSTLRFCPDPLAVVREMRRVLRPGGRAVVDAPNRSCPWYGPMKRLAGIEPHIHDRLYTQAELEALMAQGGLGNVVGKHLLFTTKRMPGAAVPVCRVMDHVLEAIPGIRSLSGIVMAAGSRHGDR
jgi:SAM-dependent methyltransferase